jgi:hypothetical protein
MLAVFIIREAASTSEASVNSIIREAASTSETSVNFCQTTRSYNPEDSHLHTRRRENLKSYLISLL